MMQMLTNPEKFRDTINEVIKVFTDIRDELRTMNEHLANIEKAVSKNDAE